MIKKFLDVLPSILFGAIVIIIMGAIIFGVFSLYFSYVAERKELYNVRCEVKDITDSMNFNEIVEYVSDTEHLSLDYLIIVDDNEYVSDIFKGIDGDSYSIEDDRQYVDYIDSDFGIYDMLIIKYKSRIIQRYMSITGTR